MKAQQFWRERFIVRALGPLDDRWWRKKLVFLGLGSLVTPILALVSFLRSDQPRVSSIAIVFALALLWGLQFAVTLAIAHASVPILKEHSRREAALIPAGIGFTRKVLLAVVCLLVSAVGWGFIDPTAVWTIFGIAFVLFIALSFSFDHRRRENTELNKHVE